MSFAMKNRVKAFTLIELMVVIAVIGILAAIAYPSYVRYVERTQFNDGRAGLLVAAQGLERCYVTNMSYEEGDPRVACPIPATSPEGFYDLGLDVTNGGQGFLLTADGVAGRVSSGPCVSITLDQTGEMNQFGCPH